MIATGTDLRFLVEHHIRSPEIFSVTGPTGYEVISLYDRHSGDFVPITEPGDHYIRHALRAITSAASRFYATFSDTGERLPLIHLGKNLHAAREFDTCIDAQLSALEGFTAGYDPTDNWPTFK